MIKAVLFDFDETLQDRTAAFEKYMDLFLDEFCPDISLQEKNRRKEDMVSTGNGGYVDREEWYQSLIDKWHWSDAPSKTVLANHYDNRFGDCCVIFKNTVPLLKELKERGLIVGIITNGPSYLQNHKLDQSGLRKYCDITVVSGDVGVHNAHLIAAAAHGDCQLAGDHGFAHAALAGHNSVDLAHMGVRVMGFQQRLRLPRGAALPAGGAVMCTLAHID